MAEDQQRKGEIYSSTGLGVNFWVTVSNWQQSLGASCNPNPYTITLHPEMLKDAPIGEKRCPRDPLLLQSETHQLFCLILLTTM